ncbi:hypothetical protein OSTOST_19553 [Ostertagia ostertagi]
MDSFPSYVETKIIRGSDVSEEPKQTIFDSVGLDSDDLNPASFFTTQRWANWFGKYNESYRRVDRAPIFSLNNRHFAGTLLRGLQMATLTLQTETVEPFAVSFDSWEATRELQLRVCCDDFCPLSTYSGYRMGDRSWRRLALQCPAGTRTVGFLQHDIPNKLYRTAFGLSTYSYS